MPSKKPLITVNVSPQQKKALELAEKQSGLTASQARRMALRLFCEKEGVVWPDDMAKHGGQRDKSELLDP